jgi:hypothetical protein
MKKPLALAIAATLGSTLMMPVVAAEQAGSLQEAVKGGTVDLNFRMRYEDVEQDNALDDASALTLKSRLTYTTKSYKDFQAQIEVDNVSELTDENHNDSQNGMGDHSKIVDPEGSEINQAWIAYSGISDTVIKHGRQRVNLDNQRFIGGVAWRQNEQTYDATAVINSSLPDTTVMLAYVKGVNTITEADLDTDTTLAHISYSGLSFAKVSLYNYDIEAGDGGDTFKTSGIRLTGEPEVAGLKLKYELEYAKQDREIFGTSNDNDAKYTHASLGTTLGPVGVKIGQEVLGSDDGAYGFQTPLATKHKFNGFADVFLATPADGLEDSYLTLSGKCPLTGAKLSLTYHEFDSDEGSVDYGDEINFAAAKKVTDNLKVVLKYADYSKGDSGTTQVDTQKFWIQAQMNF